MLREQIAENERTRVRRQAIDPEDTLPHIDDAHLRYVILVVYQDDTGRDIYPIFPSSETIAFNGKVWPVLKRSFIRYQKAILQCNSVGHD